MKSSINNVVLLQITRTEY